MSAQTQHHTHTDANTNTHIDRCTTNTSNINNNLNFISLHVHVQAFSGTSLAKEFHMPTATDNAHKAAQPLKRTDAIPLWVLCRSPFRRSDSKRLDKNESPLRPRLALLSRHELDQIDCLLDSRGMDRLQMLNTYSQRPDHSRFCETIAGLLILRLPAEQITFCTRSAGHVRGAQLFQIGF